MCSALADACFGPIADIHGELLDHFVGSIQQAEWHGETERLGGLQVDHEIEFSWLQNW
jgi:hypothetical protein